MLCFCKWTRLCLVWLEKESQKTKCKKDHRGLFGCVHHVTPLTFAALFLGSLLLGKKQSFTLSALPTSCGRLVPTHKSNPHSDLDDV